MCRAGTSEIPPVSDDVADLISDEFHCIHNLPHDPELTNSKCRHTYCMWLLKVSGGSAYDINKMSRSAKCELCY
jgi:hypothetical protein